MSSNSKLIPQTFLDELISRVDLLQVIGHHLKLRKSGLSHVAKCPFHQEDSASFSVRPDKGMYKCFGCGASGNAITFLIEYEGLPFRQAVETLAHSVGMSLNTPDSSTSTLPDRQHIDALHEVMLEAAHYYNHALNHSEQAIAYVESRGITQEGSSRFMMGYAPQGWQNLQEAFGDYANDPRLPLAGLVKDKESSQADKSTRRFDVFRDRITFAIRNSKGNVVAFGARALNNETQPKYLNSPETPIFNKSAILFGLYEARQAIRAQQQVIVVEGYMDTVMLAQHGVENTVATMGTAFTAQHFNILNQHTKSMVFAFDGDSAGKTAAWRTLECVIELIDDEHDIRFVLLPQGSDPDDLIQREGSNAWRVRLKQSMSLTQFLIGELTARNNHLSTLEDKARFVAQGQSLANKMKPTTILGKLLNEHIAQSLNG